MEIGSGIASWAPMPWESAAEGLRAAVRVERLLGCFKLLLMIWRTAKTAGSVVPNGLKCVRWALFVPKGPACCSLCLYHIVALQSQLPS